MAIMTEIAISKKTSQIGQESNAMHYTPSTKELVRWIGLRT
jgi:hypothetical protein